MKLSVAVLSAVSASKREPDAERRLAKIIEKGDEYKSFAQAHDLIKSKKLTVIEARVDRLMNDIKRIDTSACPLSGVDEDKLEVDEDFVNLCDASGKLPSMIRSYARKFGCQAGFPKKSFLERLIKRSHKLKRVTQKAGKCDQLTTTTTAPIVTGTPFSFPTPMLEKCDEGFHAVCEELTNSEIYFENQWTCRNCFRVRATYGQNSGFKFNPAKGDFVSVRFTEPVVWQTFNHPVESVREIGDDNTWKIDFKHDGNFMSGMIFEGNLQTSDSNLHVDGNWIIESAESCRCKVGPPPPPPCELEDPCQGKLDCQTFINACSVTPSRANRIATISGSKGYVVSAEVQCGESSGDWGGIVHINTGTSREVFGDRYFTLWAKPDGGIKFNAPLKDNGEYHEVEYNVDCTVGEWNTYKVEQKYVDSVLELSIYVDEEILGTHVVRKRHAFTGELFVEAAGDFHPAAESFKVRNFYHQTLPPAPHCDNFIDPCDGDDSCDALVWNCPIRPSWSNLLREVDGDAVYDASVDVFCRKTDGHGWQNVVHMTQGTNRDQFGDRYFTIWQRADGKLKLNGPLKGNTQFDEVEYFVDCEDETWTNIAISQTQRDGGLLELSMFQDGELLGSDLLHSRDAFTGPIKVYASNPFMPPAEFFQIKNFYHRSAPYVAAPCVATDPCEDLEKCETLINSCPVAPWSGTRLADISAHEEFKISAEVMCTDRVAASWENVLHVHTGTNREHFGDRYFTIWKQAGMTDGIRIVAPAFGNPHHELNAYVNCAPGWHTFTVQQSKTEDNNFNLEIFFDDVVVESQVVDKSNTYNGPLFVDVANDFHWPAAYDHQVRNFYHQDMSCSDPCFGKDNCTTFVNACEISPAQDNRITRVDSAVNYKVSAEIFCAHNMPLNGQWKNVVQLTAGQTIGNVGDRTFAVFRYPSENRMYMTVTDPNLHKFEKVMPLDCTEGEWNTYSVEVRQQEDAPMHVRYTMFQDDVEVFSSGYDANAGYDGSLKAYASNPWMESASEYSLRNFYFQTFNEVACTSSDPCDGLADCTAIVGSCGVAPTKGTLASTVSASLNFKASADVKCNHNMPLDGRWKNVLHMTGGGALGNIGDRTFAIFRKQRQNQLYIAVNDPTGSHNERVFNVDCNDGEWNNYSVEVRALEDNPTNVKFTLKQDDTVVGEGVYPASGAYSDGDLEAWISHDTMDSGSSYYVKNFIYQTFA